MKGQGKRKQEFTAEGERGSGPVRPLSPETLSILVGLVLKLISYKFRKVWTV